MRYHELGSSGISVSAVGLGCNNFGGHDRPRVSDAPVARLDGAHVTAIVLAALDAGVTMLDTADIYGNRGGSEELLGIALRGRRSKVVLATKFGENMGVGSQARGSRGYVRSALEASLRRLQTDWVDLYYYHRPDRITPIDETLVVLDELVREGKVRAIGLSNFNREQLEEALKIDSAYRLTPISALQNACNLLDPAALWDLVPRCCVEGVGFVPYFPLAEGLLTGKYRRGRSVPADSRIARKGFVTEGELERIETLTHFASERGHTLLELAVAGLASTPGVASVIAGSTSPEQARDNAAAGDWLLDPGEFKELREILEEARDVT
jgi:aryl-alcohol dehydrogenase-like predicted oxidoreductase